MTIYAVMKIGGKEYRVAPGDVVRVEKLAAAPGATVEIREVCSIEIGQDVTVGSPTVANARVVAEVVEEGHGEKIVSFKKKRRNHYQMTMEDVRSYTVLLIRDIAVGESVAAVPPPQIVKPERKPRAPQAKKPLQPAASPPPAAVELPPPVAARDDAPVAPQEAQPSSDAAHPVHPAELPAAAPASPPAAPMALPPPMAARRDASVASPVHALELPPSAPSSTEPPPAREPRKRSYAIAALAVAVLVSVAGLLVSGGSRPRGPVEVATAVAAPQEARAAVPQPAAKAPPRKETAIRNPAAASAPSAPVQPPE